MFCTSVILYTHRLGSAHDSRIPFPGCCHPAGGYIDLPLVCAIRYFNSPDGDISPLTVRGMRWQLN